jgi:hypothetical protein
VECPETVLCPLVFNCADFACCLRAIREVQPDSQVGFPSNPRFDLVVQEVIVNREPMFRN